MPLTELEKFATYADGLMTASIDAASGVTTQSIGKINGEYRTNKRPVESRFPH